VLTLARAAGQPAVLSRLVVLPHEGAGFVVRRVEGIRFDREFALVWAGSVTELKASVQAVAEYILDLPFARSRHTGREFRLE
jgi:hypothetical protein